MTRFIIMVTLSTLVLAVCGLASEPAINITKNLTSMPLTFTENQGQWDAKVLFRAVAGGAAMWLTADGAYYQFTRRIPADDGLDNLERTTTIAPDRKHDNVETMLIKASFVGANPSPVMRGEALLDYKCNYFLGSDPAGWRTDVVNYGAIVYEQVYPGIDLKYYGNGREMEYDFIVAPGADPSRIRVQYEGVESISINADGELVVKTRWGEVIERRPVVYQSVDGTRVPIKGRYEITADNSFGFSVGAGYDPALPLVIDPILSYSTYLGGSDGDYGYDIAVDGSGCAYVTGTTLSSDFPTENPFQTDQGTRDVFVTKVNSSGNGLVYSTYLGGDYSDYGRHIAIDGSGCAYVTGYTESSNFPIENAYQTTHQSDFMDAFVTKLNSSGNGLIYSTFLGGGDYDYGHGIAVDASGCAYVTGYTASTDFPTENPFQTDQGGRDAFVTKLNSLGNALVYSTYLGGSGVDYGFSIAVDGSGCAYVTGDNYSGGFPTENPFQTYQGSQDVFVTKLNSSGNGLVYSTYLGGITFDGGEDITVDGSGCAYVTGHTQSSNFPVENPYQAPQGAVDAFVTKLNSSGDGLIYSTFLGGSAYDYGQGIAVDASGCTYVSGRTESTNFPTENAYQTDQGGYDAFVTKLNSSGNSLIYSTYLGGSTEDYGYAVAVDASDCAYVTGYTASTDFPNISAYQGVYQGGSYDAFVTKLVEGTPCCELRGDLDDNQQVDVLDLDYFIDWLYRTGPAPACEEEANVDGNSQVDILDIDYFIDWLYRGGPDLVPCP